MQANIPSVCASHDIQISHTEAIKGFGSKLLELFIFPGTSLQIKNGVTIVQAAMR